MDSEADLLNENIGEYVNDDNKIVTCKWLSLTQSININAAKRALHAFVDRHQKRGGNSDINVTYFVAGLGKSKDGGLMHKCAVVPESELEEVKGSLSVLTSCHIFSVQKAKLKDYTPLYMTDYDIVKNNLEKCNRFSSIKCPWVSLKSANAPPRIIQQAVVKPENKENAPSKKLDSSKDSNSSAAKAPAQKAEPKGSIASMFASANKKGDGGNQSAKPVQKTDAPAPKAKVPEKKGGVMAFLEKGGDSSSNKKSKVSPKKPESKIAQKQKQEAKRRQKQMGDSDDEAPDKKRRKRIRTDLFDSSDEEDAEASGTEDQQEEEVEVEDNKAPNNEEESDETKAVEEKQEEEEEKEFVSISSSNSSAASGKKRKRTKKVVTKHYQDEEGFMVTKKETVWESETDDEEETTTSKQEPPPKKTATEAMGKPAAKNTGAKAEPKGKTAAKKNVSPQKSKQTSLMSFFKKK